MSFNYSPKIITDGLLFHVDAANIKSYNMDSNFVDLKSGSVGTLQNSPTFSSSYYGGLILDGIDDYIEFQIRNPILSDNSFTLCAWLDVKTHSDYGFAFFIGNATTDNSAYIGYVDVANVGSSNSIGGGFYGHNWGSGVSTNTGPHYVSFSYLGSGGTASLYVDGVLKSAETRSVNLTNNSISIGRANTGTTYSFNGTVFSCSIYNKCLTVSEIQQNYKTTRSRFGL